MALISDSFTSATAGTSFQVNGRDQVELTITGTFSATLVLEKSDNNGVAWETVEQFTTTQAAKTYYADFGGSRQGMFRVRCSAYTSGTAVAQLKDVVTTLNSVKNPVTGKDIYKITDQGLVFVDGPLTEDGVGSTAVSTVEVREEGNAALHRTEITLTNCPVSVVSVTTGNGVGGTTIYDFPEGYIHIHGATANLSVGVETQADFTDGTPEGDIGIGTLAPANADALGTDATDDNICTATAFTMTDYVDSSVTLPPEASANYDGTSTAVNLVLTALVDAADIDDDTTTNLLVSGTVVVLWSNLGDY